MDGAIRDGGEEDGAIRDDGGDGAMPARVEARSAEELCRYLLPGDVLLVGHEGWASQITKWVTVSDYGHAIIYVGNNQFLESTDKAFTPKELDDGVYRLSAEALFDRMVTYTSAVVLRPESIDPVRVQDVAEEMARRAAGYPTVSIPLIGFSCLAARHLHRLPVPVRRRVGWAMVMVLADGVRRMHCTELVMRIYAALGQPIELRDPVLQPVIDAARLSGREPFPSRWRGPLDIPYRTAEPGRWPRSRVVAGAVASVWLVAALRARVDRATERHEKELTVPEDLANASTFKLAIPINCESPDGGAGGPADETGGARRSCWPTRWLGRSVGGPLGGSRRGRGRYRGTLRR
jgi:hypothetical protein